MGFFGLIISIPTAAAVKTLFEEYYFKEPPEAELKAGPIESNKEDGQEAA